jgi:hypothetical protein
MRVQNELPHQNHNNVNNARDAKRTSTQRGTAHKDEEA